jgi:response regulator NasT
MEYVLVVSGTEKGRESISSLLREAGGCPAITAVSSGSEARRLILDGEWDLVVVNSPLPDESGEDLARMVTERTLSAVILMVRMEFVDEVSAVVEDAGVLVVPKPIVRQMFLQTLKLANAMRRRLTGLRSENSKLQQKIEEIKLVDRAKCALIQYLNMGEQQAHRYIEKQAMDLRSSRRDVAERIIKTYEKGC